MKVYVKTRDARRIFGEMQAPRSGKTRDLQPSKASGTVFASEKIGIKRYLTPEGYLYCEDVPIARTGEMIYGANEVPVSAGTDGLVRISRNADHLFNPSTLASFNGKSIVNDHPEDETDVTPKNWKQLTVGVVLNPRRGRVDDEDVILADFMVTDETAIADIEAGKVEVSCGYDAMYLGTTPGRGIQTDIIGNHVALVNRGRCGPRCAIGDQQLEEEDDMKTRDNANPAATADTPAARIRKHFGDAADRAVAELGSSGDGGQNIHIHLGEAAQVAKPAATADAATGLAEQIAAAVTAALAPMAKTVDGLVKKLKVKKTVDADPDEEEDDDGKTMTDDEETEEEMAAKAAKEKTADSAALSTGYQTLIAGMEILVPGLSMPTFDSSARRNLTVDRMCQGRRRALDRLSASAEGEALVKSVNGGKTFDSVTCDCKATAAIFKAAVAAKSASNNRATTGDSAHRVADAAAADGQLLGSTPALTPAMLNKRNKDFWKAQGVRV